MNKYVVVLNQPVLAEADTADDARLAAEDLAARNPGVSYDVLMRVTQSVAKPPAPVEVVAETQTFEQLVADETPVAVDPISVVPSPLTSG